MIWFVFDRYVGEYYLIIYNIVYKNDCFVILIVLFVIYIVYVVDLLINYFYFLWFFIVLL